MYRIFSSYVKINIDLFRYYSQNLLNNLNHFEDIYQRDIVRCSDIKEEIIKEINEFKEPKLQLKTLPRFGSLLNGFRVGELTIFSGPTGVGKTTVLSQISLDYCMQGIETLWGSFEIRKSLLGKLMMQQISGLDVPFEDSFTKFSKLDMYFMNFFGPTDLSKIITAMHQSININNIKHIILDNLQFMSLNMGTNNFDRFDITDKTIGAIRSFATKYNVHITLVIHPRKENDYSQLGIASISGTSKATQEADNVIILQNLEYGRFIELKKNRYDGAIGKFKIGFNKSRKMVSNPTCLAV